MGRSSRAGRGEKRQDGFRSVMVAGFTRGIDMAKADFLYSALQMFLALLEQGYEWPDAQWKVLQAFPGVSIDDLTEAYDNRS